MVREATKMQNHGSTGEQKEEGGGKKNFECDEKKKYLQANPGMIVEEHHCSVDRLAAAEPWLRLRACSSGL